jgi:hypothetical protein
MMKQILASLSVCSLLLGCGETTNPINYGADDVVPDEEVVDVPEEEVLDEVVFNTLPSAIGGDLNRITFNPATETLQVDMSALDASEALATYARAPALDRDGLLTKSTRAIYNGHLPPLRANRIAEPFLPPLWPMAASLIAALAEVIMRGSSPLRCLCPTGRPTAAL